MFNRGLSHQKIGEPQTLFVLHMIRSILKRLVYQHLISIIMHTYGTLQAVRNLSTPMIPTEPGKITLVNTQGNELLNWKTNNLSQNVMSQKQMLLQNVLLVKKIIPPIPWGFNNALPWIAVTEHQTFAQTMPMKLVEQFQNKINAFCQNIVMPNLRTIEALWWSTGVHMGSELPQIK